MCSRMKSREWCLDCPWDKACLRYISHSQRPSFLLMWLLFLLFMGDCSVSGILDLDYYPNYVWYTAGLNYAKHLINPIKCIANGFSVCLYPPSIHLIKKEKGSQMSPRGTCSASEGGLLKSSFCETGAFSSLIACFFK